MAQSQALVADGIHSLSDLLSDALVYWAAHHAHHGPDEKHPYGHGRFETAATLGLGALLILVGAGIAWDAIDRLFTPERLTMPGMLALVVATASILSKELLYHYTVRVARQVHSEMLKANAWHHRSDAVSSIVVLVGVGGTMAGLPYLDAIAAVGVALMVAKIGWELGQTAFHELVDAGLEEERLEKIRDTIRAIGGVEDIHMLRTRRMGGQASVDVHVLVEPKISVSEGHMISQTVIETLQDEFQEVSDVTVHIDPEDDEVAAPCHGLPLRKEALSLLDEAWRDIAEFQQNRQVILHYLDGRIDVDLYFAHEQCQNEVDRTALLGRLQSALKGVSGFGEVGIYYGGH
jgi:cation diffusion facilitator family transporter